MATLIEVDGREIKIDPGNSEQGLLPRQLFSLIGQTVRMICLDQHSLMVVKHDMTAEPHKNYRATKLLQFFTKDRHDEVRGPALLVQRSEIHLEFWTTAPFW